MYSSNVEKESINKGSETMSLEGDERFRSFLQHNYIEIAGICLAILFFILCSRGTVKN